MGAHESGRPFGIRVAMVLAGLSVVFPVLLVFVWAGDFGLALIGAPAVVLVWLIAAAIATGVCIWLAARKSWRAAGLAAVLPIMTAAVATRPGVVWGTAIDLGERLHFEVMRGRYVAQVERAAAPVGRRLQLFSWGGFGVGHGVVYDDSDEILLPSERRSADWKERAKGTELECGVWGKSVGDHFYIVRTGC